MFKAIVFDLDGTLVDSPLCFQTIRRELDLPEDEFILEYLETLPDEARREKHRRLEKIEKDAAMLAVAIPGAIELLADLRLRKVLLGVFTRNCRSATEIALAAVRGKFDLVVTRDDAPPKPNPNGLRKFLTAWGIDGNELLFVGDFRFDIECGIRAGVKTALFTNGTDVSESHDAHFVIHNYGDFWAFLGSPLARRL